VQAARFTDAAITPHFLYPAFANEQIKHAGYGAWLGPQLSAEILQI
jgi:hypothetical protein